MENNTQKKKLWITRGETFVVSKSLSSKSNPWKRYEIISVALLLIIFCGLIFLKPSITGYTVLELNETFERRVECDGCNETYIPGGVNVSITITAMLSETVENATLVEYYPSSWSLIDAGGGIVSVADENHFKIEWPVSNVDTITKTYVVIAPEDSTDFMFDAKVFVTVPEEVIEENVSEEINITEVNITEEVNVTEINISRVKIRRAFELKTSERRAVKALIKLKTKQNILLKEFDSAEEQEIDSGEYNIEVIPEQGPVTKIELFEAMLTENTTEFVGIDDVPEDKVTEKEFMEVYAIDPTAVNFTEATVTVTAKGTELYKCKDWNFEEQSCEGSWELFKTGLVPGEAYSFILTPDDPGFGEGFETSEASGTPSATLAFFMSSEGFIGSDKIVSSDNFDECPIQLNDYGSSTEKCELWDCTAWSVSSGQGIGVYCNGGWNCTSWNGVTCETYKCEGWLEGNAQLLPYCSGGWDCEIWNESYCEYWNCQGWAEAVQRAEVYCDGVWNCTNWNESSCDKWDCTSWDETIEKVDEYCSGVWDCTVWKNGDVCETWDCTAWTNSGSQKVDRYNSDGWNCSAWNENYCDQWQGLGSMDDPTGQLDVYCDRWNCSYWDETKKVCGTWNCLQWIQAAQKFDAYCSGVYNCTTWKIFDTTPPTYSNDQDDSSGSVVEGTIVNVSVYWQDNIELNTAIFRTNQSGSWQNVSICALSGTSSWCNKSIDTTGDAGKTICWNQYANDTRGNLNNSMPETVHCFNVTSADTDPTISLDSPPNNAVDVDGNITFNCSATDDINLRKIELYFNSILNQSNNVSGLSNETAFYIYNLANGNYNWSCRSYDAADNFNQSATRNLVVNVTIAPTYNESYFSGNTTDWDNEPDITNVSEPVLDNPDTAMIQWEGSVNAEDADFNINVILGYNNVTLITEGLHSSFNSSATLTIRNLTWDAAPLVYIDGELCPETICSNVSYDIVTGTAIFNVTHFTSYTTKGNSQLEIWDETDTGMPYADQTRYPYQQVRFFANYTKKTDGSPVTGANCTINFTDSNGIMVYNATTALYEYNRSFATNGTFDWNVTCSAAGAQTLTTNDTVFISADVVAPNIILNYPPDGFNKSSTAINFNWTATNGADPVLDCNLTIDGVVNVSNIPSLSGMPTNRTVSGFADGTRYWNITCVDDNGNANTSETRIFTVDATAPVWSNNKTSPVSPATYSLGASYQFNVTWIDTGLDVDTVVIEHNFTGTLNNYTVTAFVGDEYYHAYSDLVAGTYVWREYANDTAGNENVTDQWTYIVNKETTILTLTASPSWSVINGTQTNVSCYANNNEVNSSLWRNNTFISSSIGGVISDVQTLALGDHSYVCNTTGSQNYTAASESNILTVTLKNPSYCYLSFDPASGQTWPVSVNASCYCTNPEASAQLWRNGTNITDENNQYIVLAVGDYLYVCNVSETVDYASATNSSVYTIIKASSVVNLTLNGNDNDISIESGDYVNITGYLIIPSSGYIKLYRNGSLINSGYNYLTNYSQYIIPYNYNITVLYPATQNYSASYETHFINVTDTIAPIWTPLPQNQIIEHGYAFSYDVDATDVQAITYSINDTINFAIDPVTGVITNATLLAIGIYGLEINATDASNNVNSTAITITVQDTIPPLITNVRNTSITDISVNISWDTNELADSVVKYGIVSGDYTYTPSNATKTLTHSFVLTGLSPGTTYYYVVNSTDSSNNSNQSSEYSLQTLPDSTPPEVIDLKPITGTNYNQSQTVLISANITDYSAVSVKANISWGNGSREQEMQRRLFYDDFSDVNLTGWIAVLGNWTVSEGEVFTAVSENTRSLIVTGDLAWSNYTYSSKVKESNRAVSGDMDGALVFRYQDQDNYYKIEVDTDIGLHIDRFLDGNETILANDTSFTYETDTWYIQKVQVNGSDIRIKVYKQGTAEPDWMLSIADNSFLTGKVGYTIFSSNATFDDPRVNLLEKDGLSGVYDCEFTNTAYIGQYNVTIITNDTRGNVNSSETTYFYVNDVTWPVVRLMYPENNSYNDININFTFNASDNSGFNLNCSLYIDGVLNATNESTELDIPTIFKITGLSQGLGRTWNITCVDVGNNVASSERVFNIDITAPIANITSPANNTNTTDPTPTITFVLIDNLASVINYSVFVDDVFTGQKGVASNNTPVDLDMISLSQTNHTIIIQAIDTAGNKQNSTPLTITIVPPTVYLTYPKNNEYINSLDINFIFNVSDPTFPTLNCSLYINGVLNQTNESVNQSVPTIFSVTGLQEGAGQTWNVSCINPENVSASDIFVFNIDVTAPVWSNNKTKPASGVNYSVRDYQFNITWNDNINIDAVRMEHNFTGNFDNYSMSGNKSAEYYYDYGTLGADSYVWRSYANDSAGNMNSTDQFDYIVNKAVTVLSITIDPGDNVSYGALTTVSCSADNSEVSPRLYRNNVLVSSPDSGVLAPGSYSYICNNTATQNYTAGAVSANLTISIICTDADGDSYATEGGICGLVDCDDTNAAIYPGATEVCNNVDDDCDGAVDEDLVCCGNGVCEPGKGETTETCPADCPVAPRRPTYVPPAPPPAIEPVEVITPEGEIITELTPAQITEIRETTTLRYTPKVEGAIALGKSTLKIGFTNIGKKAIKNVTFMVEKPLIEKKAEIMHPRKVWGWDVINMMGWILKSHVRELELLEWQVSEPEYYDIINPGESIDIDLGVVTPLTKLKLVDLKLKILSYGQVVYEEIIPVEINTTQFLVVADVHNESNLVDLYMIISNFGDEDKEYNVEFDINSEPDPGYKPTSSIRGLFKAIFGGPRTLVAEYYGPYRIKAKDTKLFAYQYEYSDKFADDYYIKYSLYEERKKIRTAAGDLNLTKKS